MHQPRSRRLGRKSLRFESLESRQLLSATPTISIGDATAIEGSDQLKLLDQFIASESGGLARPRVPQFGPDSTGDGVNELYVASADTDEILRYDGSTGAFLDVFVPAGSGGLDAPLDLEFAPDGNLYVSTHVNQSPEISKVLRYDGITGAFLEEIASGLNGAHGISWHEGALYVTTHYGSEVFKYDSTGFNIFVSAGSGGLNGARHALFGADANGDASEDLYVASQNTKQVLRYDGRTGAFIDVFATMDTLVVWIEFGPDGDLYVVGAQTGGGPPDIARFDTATREVLDVFSIGQAGWPVTADAQGILYNSNIIDRSVYRYSASSLAAFTVSLSAPSSTPVTVDYQTINGAAIAGDDYVAATGTLTFAPGQTTRTILVKTLDDTASDNNETFVVNLSNPVGAEIADGQGAATIVDDDVPPAISISDATVTEGDDIARFIDVPMSAVSSPLNNPRSITRGPDGDFYVTSAFTNSVLRYDGTTFQFKAAFVSPGSGGLNTPVDLVFANGDLLVTSANTNSVLQYDGTTGAFLGEFVPPGAQGLQRPADMLVNGDQLYISAWSGDVHRYDLKTGAFIDKFVETGAGGLDDPAGIAFGPDGNFYVADIAPSGTKGVLRFDGTTGDFLGEFIPRGSGGLIRPLGMRFGPDGKLYIVNPEGDNVLRYNGNTGEFIDTFVLQTQGGLDNPTRMTFSGNQMFVTSQFTNQIMRYEVSSWAVFNVTLDSPSDVPITVDFSLVNGTASGSDYMSRSGTLSFAPGQTAQTIVVPTFNDAVFEGNETYFVNLSNSVNGVIADGQGVGTIVDDDSLTKFYVVDDASQNRTFEYTATGVLAESYNVASGNSAPRGAASTAVGNRVWVVDANKTVYIYGPDGNLLGSWSAGSIPGSPDVQGITVSGADVWIVDAKSDKVYRYANAASRLSGSQNAASSFSLNKSNANPKDLVTNGTHVWVVDDASTDKVFKYSASGSLQGSWTVSGAGSSPTGITIDPTNVSNIWIVDSGTDRVYQFDAAASRTSGSQSAAALSFALAAGNTNPQGIADPPVVGTSLPSLLSNLVLSSTTLSTSQDSILPRHNVASANGNKVITKQLAALAREQAFAVPVDTHSFQGSKLAAAVASLVGDTYEDDALDAALAFDLALETSLADG